MWRLAALVVMMIVLGGCAIPADSGNFGVPMGPGSGGVYVGTGSGYSAVTPNQMRLDWQPEARGGRIQLSGYVYNTYIMPARHVILVAEGLDAGGQVIERARTYVDHFVMPSDRAYWRVTLPQPAASYRVNIASVDWISADR
jgi:hypothetical protein